MPFADFDALQLETTHIKKLRALANTIAPQLVSVWPQNKRLHKRAFELLRRAYVEARYSLHYKITKEELEWLFERIEDLQDRVKEICETHLRKVKFQFCFDMCQSQINIQPSINQWFQMGCKYSCF